MKNLKMFTFAMFLLAITGLATSCQSGKKHHKDDRKVTWMIEKVTNKLDLNQDQQEKFKDLVSSFREQKRVQAEKHKADFDGLKTMLLSDKIEKDKTLALMDKRQNAMREGFDPVFEKLQNFHSSLTAEQKKEAVKYLEKFEKRFR